MPPLEQKEFKMLTLKEINTKLTLLNVPDDLKYSLEVHITRSMQNAQLRQVTDALAIMLSIQLDERKIEDFKLENTDLLEYATQHKLTMRMPHLNEYDVEFKRVENANKIISG